LGVDTFVNLTVDVPVVRETVQTTNLELSADNTSEARFRERISLGARLTDASGPLEGKPVRFALLNGDDETLQIIPGRPTDADGVSVAEFDVNVPAGEYTVRASYIGSPDEYTASSDEGSLTVLTAASALAVSPEGVGNHKTVTATLTDSRDGLPLGARTVEVFANCQLIGSGQTGQDGTFSMEVPARYRAANARFAASFEGDLGSERYYSGSWGGPSC
jgi:hypothetical protein